MWFNVCLNSLAAYLHIWPKYLCKSDLYCILTILALEGENVDDAVNRLQLDPQLFLGSSGFLLTVLSTKKSTGTVMAVAKQSALHCRFFQQDLVPCPAVSTETTADTGISLLSKCFESTFRLVLIVVQNLCCMYATWGGVWEPSDQRKWSDLLSPTFGAPCLVEPLAHHIRRVVWAKRKSEQHLILSLFHTPCLTTSVTTFVWSAGQLGWLSSLQQARRQGKFNLCVYVNWKQF